MATAYLIHGFIAAGKTTLAKSIAEQMGIVRISPDEWYIALYGKDGQVGIDEELESRLTGVLWSFWPQLLAAGADVVLDMGFWTRENRDRARETVHAAGADFVLFSVATTDETALGRCSARNAAPLGAFFVEADTYDKLKLTFEPLESDEVHVPVVT